MASFAHRLFVAIIVAAAVFVWAFSRHPALKAMQKLCRERYEQFGTAGNASKIKVHSVSEMARQYAAGALDPKIAGAAAK